VITSTLLTLLALALVLAPPAETQTATTRIECEATDADLRQVIAEIHEKQRNVGLSAVIHQGGELVFSEHLGQADLEHDVEVGAHTHFGIASITKLFTAVTLLKLQTSGLIDLDAPIQKYVKSFPKKPEGEITVRMLVTHRSGIPHPQASRTPQLFATHYETATEALEVFDGDSLVAVPGSEQVYSSSNYNLLAAIIEQVAEQAFTNVVQREIFDSLNLSNTSFDHVLRPLPHRARRYSFYHPWTYEESQELFLVPLWDYSFNTGGGNIISTAADVAKFGAALTKPGILPSEELDLLYSEAWFGEHDDQGRQYIHITGANPGVQAGLTIYPDWEIAAVILSNTWGIGSRSGEMVNLAHQLAQMCIDR
jgi:serine beta-lactamase-like protein LACTB, mitochondrial